VDGRALINRVCSRLENAAVRMENAATKSDWAASLLDDASSGSSEWLENGVAQYTFTQLEVVRMHRRRCDVDFHQMRSV